MHADTQADILPKTQAMNTLYDALFAPHAGSEKAFLVNHDASVMTYDGFLKRTSQVAHAITEAGVKPGDRIVVQAGKSTEMVALYAATVQAGCVFLPLNTAYTVSEVTYFLQDSGAKLLVCDPASHADLSPIATAQGAAVLTLDKHGGGTLAEAASRHSTVFETAARGPDDLAGLLYTSGTTGRSKGAMMSHDNLLSNARTLAATWRFTSDDVLLHALPIFHTHGLFVALNISLLAGATIRFFPSFNIEHVLEAMPGCTSMMGVPTFYTRLLDDPRFTSETAQNIRLFVSGSAPLLAETHVAFEQRTGHRILERYGMTETNMITSNPYEGARKPGAVGYPLDGVEVIITNPETGEALPKGEVGMIEVRGPNVFKGYWNMPEKTKEEIRDTGFFITGDLGKYDEDGYVCIVGRQKDLIITGGYNVYPVEIEDVLNDVDGVLETAVFGIPHADFGEAVTAAVIMEPGADPDQQALEAAVSEKLGRFKHPKTYVFLEALPRNAMGKVQKNILRKTYSN